MGRVEEGFRTGAKGIYHMEIFSLQYVSRIPPNSGLGNWAVEGPPCRGDRKSAFWPNLVYKKIYWPSWTILSGEWLLCWPFDWMLPFPAVGAVRGSREGCRPFYSEPVPLPWASLSALLHETKLRGRDAEEGAITVRAPPGGFACTPILCFYFLLLWASVLRLLEKNFPEEISIFK